MAGSEEEVVTGGTKCKSASTPVASKSKTVTSTPATPKAVSTPATTSKAVASPAPVKAATPASTKAAKPAAAATPVVAGDITTPVRDRSAIEGPDRRTKAPTDSPDKTESEASPARDDALPELNPTKFTTVKKGDDGYNDNPGPDDVTTVKPTMEVKSEVNEKPVTETDPTKLRWLMRTIITKMRMWGKV